MSEPARDEMPAQRAPAVMRIKGGILGDAPSPAPVPAAKVLDHHVGLHDLLAHPNAAVSSIVRQFGEWSDERQEGSWLSRYMFWPYRTGGKPAEDGWERRWQVGAATDLLAADSYQVTAPMCDIADALYEQTVAVNGRIEPADLPSERGFLWLDKQWRRADADGNVYQARVVTWAPVSTRWGEFGCREQGVRISCWSEWGADPAAVDYLRDAADQRLMRLLGPLTLAFTVVLPFGAEFAGEEDDKVPTPLHFAYALWLLIGTEIAATGQASLPRPARRRALRSIRQDQVRVITLRRAPGHADDDGHARSEVSWSCCWLVRGFWRHLEGYGTVGRFHEAHGDAEGLCRHCSARVTWVRPHVRGPDDRPLKATPKLYRLSR